MASQKILIVDDSRMIRMQIRDMLPKGNFEVLEAQDGLEALDIISENRPNLILLDFFMPRMNGWEVVQKVQEHPRWKSIPVVMMSGRREDVEKTVPELFDYFEFLGKPFEASILLKAIKRANLKAKQRQHEEHPVAVASPSAESTESAESHVQKVESGPPVTLNGYKQESVPAQAIAHIPDAANPSSDAEAIQDLKAEIQQLRAQNSALHEEVESLKKQFKQVLLVIKKKLG
jgi:CheY-like chemotaxis protein